jgi:hypothetical protein
MAKNAVLIFFVILFAAVFTDNIAYAQQSAATAAMTPTAEFDNILRGGYAQQEFSVPLEGRAFNNVLTSGAIKDWLKIENVAVVDNMINFKLVVQPPVDAMLGRHEGFVITNTIATPGGISSTISASAAIKVAVEITANEIKQIDITSITASDSEQGSPIEIKAKIANSGNIVAKPLISVAILDSSRNEIKQVSSLLELLPTVEEGYSVFVPSEGLAVSQYYAKITALLDGAFVKEVTLPFEIRQTGSMAKAGELIKLIADQSVLVNATVQLNAEFSNTGQLPVFAKFAGEIWLADKLIGAIEGAPAAVGIGEQKLLTAEFIPKEIGLYKIKAHADYDGRQTADSYIFIDSRTSLKSPVALSLNAAVLVFWAILAIAIGVIVLRRRKKSSSDLAHRCSRKTRWD